jgi:CelD/BcsL family acetyltransferase involved in cellulose biosynthesis
MTTEATDRITSDNGSTPPSSSTCALTCRVFRSFEDLDHLRAAWDQACLRAGGSVYMTYDWVRVWWQFYGGNSELRLFVFFDGQNIEAIVPIYIQTLGGGPVRFRVARLVGANIPPKVFDPPVPHSCATEVMGQIIDQLFNQDACDLLSLGPISELQPVAKIVAAVCVARVNLVLQPKVVKGVYTAFHVPSTMDEYFNSLSKNEGKKNRRKYELRMLKKDYDTQVDVLSDPTKVSEEFERFALQHADQWAAEGKTGHFGAWPRALQYNRALVKAQAPAGRLRFIRIIANGEIIANQYTFAFGNRYFWELPSRAIEEKWDRFSLGPTGIVAMIDQAMKEGIKTVEGGLAHYDYKLRLGAKESSTLIFQIVSAKPAARARFVLFSFYRKCMRLVYHKLWYRRIMPRLPSTFWRPQPDQWLRLDF